MRRLLVVAILSLVSAAAEAADPVIAGWVDGYEEIDASDDGFGTSVAMTSTWAFVGSPGEDEVFDEGRVYAFRHVGDLWMRAGSLYAGGDPTQSWMNQPGIHLGASLGVDPAEVGDDYALLVAGAPGYEQNACCEVHSGAVAFYAVPSDGRPGWEVFLGQGIPGDQLGAAVAIDDGRRLYGTPGYDNGDLVDIGTFRFLPGYPTYQATTTIEANGVEGTSVATHGRIAVIGGPGRLEGTGLVKIFRLAVDPEPWDWTTGEVGEYAEIRGTGMGGRFGSAVATDGQAIYVGAPEDLHDGTPVGSVTVLVHDGFEWVEDQILQPADLDADARFGASVAIGDGVLVVGAPGAEGTGAAYAFERQGDAWVEVRRVLSDGDGDAFGTSVATAGGAALVGAPGAVRGVEGAGLAWIGQEGSDTPIRLAPTAPAHLPGTDVIEVFGDRLVEGLVGAGATAHVWSREPGAWTFGATLPFQSTGPNPFALMAFDANRGVAVEDLGASSLVHVVEFAGSSWSQTATFEVADASAVAVHGGTIAIGDAAAATVTVFEGSGASWASVATFDGGPDAGTHFGGALALGEGLLAVGSWDADVGLATGIGAVTVYERLGSGWVETARVHGEQAVAGDEFGLVLSVDAGEIAVGAPNDDGSGPHQGSAYVFEPTTGGWAQVAHLQAPTPGAWQTYGAALSIDGDALAVGAPTDPAHAAEPGRIHLYSKATGSWAWSASVESPLAEADDQFGQRVDLRARTLAAAAPEFQIADRLERRILLFDWGRPNDPPVVDLDGTASTVDLAVTFDAGDPPVALALPDATVSDADGDPVERLVAHLVPAPDGRDEGLIADPAGTSLVVEGIGTARIEVVGPAPAADFEAVLRTLAWADDSPSPDPTPRAVEVTASDEIDVGAPATATVTIHVEEDGEEDDTGESVVARPHCATGPAAATAWPLVLALLSVRRRRV